MGDIIDIKALLFEPFLPFFEFFFSLMIFARTKISFQCSEFFLLSEIAHNTENRAKPLTACIIHMLTSSFYIKCFLISPTGSRKMNKTGLFSIFSQFWSHSNPMGTSTFDPAKASREAQNQTKNFSY